MSAEPVDDPWGPEAMRRLLDAVVDHARLEERVRVRVVRAINNPRERSLKGVLDAIVNEVMVLRAEAVAEVESRG